MHNKRCVTTKQPQQRGDSTQSRLLTTAMLSCRLYSTASLIIGYDSSQDTPGKARQSSLGLARSGCWCSRQGGCTAPIAAKDLRSRRQSAARAQHYVREAGAAKQGRQRDRQVVAAHVHVAAKHRRIPTTGTHTNSVTPWEGINGRTHYRSPLVQSDSGTRTSMTTSLSTSSGCHRSSRCQTTAAACTCTPKAHPLRDRHPDDDAHPLDRMHDSQSCHGDHHLRECRQCAHGAGQGAL